MPPASSTAATRDRILSAARTEFARYGIAGARIDRIAKAAKTSKERVYAYFESKESLYRFVSGQELTAIVEATRMDPADLPGYAGRLHDYYTTHPEQFRLLQWGRLELDPDEATPDDPVQATMAGKLELLRRAQREGILDPSWDPIDILVLLNQIAASWAAYTDFDPADPDERDKFLRDRHAAVVTAVQRLFPAGNQSLRAGRCRPSTAPPRPDAAGSKPRFSCPMPAMIVRRPSSKAASPPGSPPCLIASPRASVPWRRRSCCSAGMSSGGVSPVSACRRRSACSSRTKPVT